MLKPSDQAEVLEALANEIRELLGQTPTHQQVIAVPFAIEEGLHETFEGFLRDPEAEEDELGGLWKNRRPRVELNQLAARLETRVRDLGRETIDNGNDTMLATLADGHVPAAEIYEEFPDVTSSLGKLLRLLTENPEIRWQGSPLRMTVHIEDFARFAEKVRGAPEPD